MTPILHHFELSPFSEKMRLILGFKRLAWRSVLIPMAMPKPDVLALTGGHRRTPTLQIGADIYCDTALMAQVIDTLSPEPPLLPSGAALAPAVAAWADGSVFWQVIMSTQSPAARSALFAGMPPAERHALAADRAAFTSGLKRPNPADALAQLQSTVAMLNQALGAQPWLLGTQPSIADFSVYHCLWFTARAGMATQLLHGHAALGEWFTRMAAFGHGQREEISGEAAIAIAAQTSSRAPVQVQPGSGFEAGERIRVAATDYGTEPTHGTLVGLGPERVTLARTDPRAGLVHVHFPRRGFEIVRETSDALHQQGPA